MKIITALVNPTLNKRLLKIKKFEVLAPDIQYQDGVIEILKEKDKIDALVLSEILPGELNIYELINKILSINNEVKVVIVLENKKDELEKFLINKGIINIFYNNKNSIDEIVTVLNEKKESINNKCNNVIKYKANNNLKISRKTKRKCFVISVLGSYESGKSIFSINLVKNFKNKKVLLIDFDILYNSIHSILGIKKYPKINNKKITYEKMIIKLSNNFHLISGINMLFPNKVSNDDIKNMLTYLKTRYDYIIIDTSSDCFFDVNKALIKYSNKCIFLLEANVLEIKKAKNLLSIYLEKWQFKKEKFNIVINKYNTNSISLDIIKNIFSDFKILGKIDYDRSYNVLINRNFKSYFLYKKLRKQYKKIIHNLFLAILQSKIKRLGEKNGRKFIRS